MHVAIKRHQQEVDEKEEEIELLDREITIIRSEQHVEIRRYEVNFDLKMTNAVEYYEK